MYPDCYSCFQHTNEITIQCITKVLLLQITHITVALGRLEQQYVEHKEKFEKWKLNNMYIFLKLM